jgi:hypothetical protein
MLMKEQESKRFICPEMSDSIYQTCCLGPNCAMWQWVDPLLVKENRRGYCGKVGKPLSEFYEE